MSIDTGYSVTIDDSPFTVGKDRVTGAELQELAGSQLVELMANGTQRTVLVDQVYDLKEMSRFKKRPHFRRG